nr:DUF5801 repeats-in-toxin domain-containing protein [Qipengyuania oceanensis]
MNLAALLVGATPDAGPQPGATVQSSGNNFAVDPGDIQPAFDLGNLLPYTELAFPEQQDEEIIPYLPDEDPEVVIQTPNNPAGATNAIATVNENGLPVRNTPVEPQGTQEPTSSETTAGTIVFAAPDGLQALFLDGVSITAGSVGSTFQGDHGTLTITSVNLATGEVGFSYTLTDNTLGGDTTDTFDVRVVDTDGDEATATLTVDIIDDVPIARADANTIPAGTFGPIEGTVLANDESGADDYPVGTRDDGSTFDDAVTGFRVVNNGGTLGSTVAPGSSLQGVYGVLTLNADGTYTYVRDYNTPGGVTDTFNYTIVDQDGSTSNANLVITIENALDTVSPPEIGEGTTVNEAGLPPRGDEPVGTGEGADGNPNNNSDDSELVDSEISNSTITFNSPDGLAAIIINGVQVNLDNDPASSADDQTIVDDATGTLVITGVTYDPVTGEGTIDYTYTLKDNTLGDNDVNGGNTTVSFPIEIIDLDGDSTADNGPDNLVITIIDDAPEAQADTGSVTEGATLVSSPVSVLDNDIAGADGISAIEGVRAAGGDTTTQVSGGVGTPIVGLYGTLTLNPDGTYTYAANPNQINSDQQDVFVYTIRDGDGDLSTTTLTINIDNVGAEVTDNGAIVYEAGLPDGTGELADGNAANQSDTSEIFTGGQITVTGATGPFVYILESPADGTYGTLTLNADGSYTYTLDTAFTDTDAVENTTNTVLNAESFNYRVEDSLGNVLGTGSIQIDIVDDVPLATNDGELASVDDNATAVVIGTVADLLANDLYGADGQGTPAITIVGTGSLGGTVTIVGGNLVYTSATNITAPYGDVVETFTYQIQDGDDDTATATFQVRLTDEGPSIDPAAASFSVDEDGLPGGLPGGPDDLAGEATVQSGTLGGLSFGVDGPGGITLTAVADTGLVSLAGNPIETVWDGATRTLTGQDSVTGEAVFTLVITDLATGAYTFTLLQPVAHPTANTEDEQSLSIGVVVSDAEGETANGSITVVIDDDSPVVTLADSNGLPQLVTDDTDITDTAGPVSFAGLFDVAFGADGFKDADDNDVADADAVTYALSITGGNGTDSGLNDTLSGDDILLRVNASGEIEGYLSGDPTVVAFTITVDANAGTVSLEQARAIYNDNPADPVESGAGAEQMVGDLIKLTATATDGDLDTASATLDITDAFAFEDDGPSVSVVLNAQAQVNLDESGDGAGAAALNTGGIAKGDDPHVAGSGAISKASSGSAIVSFAANNPLYGADGQGAAPVYALQVNKLTALSDVTLTDGSTITLQKVGDVIVGVVNNGSFAGQAAFAIGIDSATGVVSVEQYLSLKHPIFPNNYDETIDLDDGSVSVTVTVTDGDLDKATSAAVDISANINFDDDGPSVSVVLNAQAQVNLDESGDGAGAAALNTGGIAKGDDPHVAGSGAISKASSGSAIVSFAANNPLYGADGQGAAPVYALQVNKLTALSDVTLTDGSTITLQKVGDVIVGVVNNGSFAGQAAFAIGIDSATGVVSVEQYLSLKHPIFPNNYDETIDLDDGSVSVTVTVTDGDLDKATSAAVDISANINFDDDGPSVTVNASPVATVDLDETATASVAPTIDVGGLTIGNDPHVPGSGYISRGTSNSSVVSFTANGGADGTASVTFALTVLAGGPDSGLNVTDGSSIFLQQLANGNVVGVVQGGTYAGQVAFAIQINATTGVVTVEQYLSLFHDNPNNPDDTVDLDANTLGVVATITDGDGDKRVSSPADISEQINFDDDGPTFTSKTAALLDDSDTPTGTGTFIYKIGADGPSTTVNEVLLNSFSGKVGSANILNPTVSAGTVSGDDITYNISFNYAPNPDKPGITVAATGTVTFETDTGNYIVTLDQPIESYEISSVFGDTTINYLQSPTNPYTGNGQDEVAVVDFQSGDFYAQFTGIAQKSGLATNGEYIGSEGYVQLSSVATGVNGNAIQNDEALDFNFYATNPGNNPNLAPTASATGFYIKLTQFNSGKEDFIIVLKLADPNDPANYITRALRVDSNDVLTTNQDGYPTVGTNEGLIIIEPNDYLDLPAVPDNYEIVGVQFLSSSGPTIPTLWDFNGQLNAAGSNSIVSNNGTNDQDVAKIIDIGVVRTTTNSEALTLDLNVTVTDGDGDSFNQTLFVNPTAPIVLDMDVANDNPLFSSLAANVAYDYDGDGVKTKTAWIAAGAAILAYDANNDGYVTDASEFVFGGNGLTDLQAVAAMFDDNADGVLDASDAAYGKFGVWLDSNLDGNPDAGEFVTLADAGISSIDLVSDGIVYGAADGDVTVFGSASYTMTDGTVGTVADAGFVTGGNVDATMDALLTLAAEATKTVDAESTKQVDIATVEDALADVADAAAIDTIVNHFADASDGQFGEHLISNQVAIKVADGAFGGHEMLDIGLVNAAPMVHGALIADMADDASALAAAAA